MLFTRWIKSFKDFGVQAAWMHWNRLGLRGSGNSTCCSVDLEALLLLTALVGTEDARLWEGTKGWLVEGGYEEIISIDRLKNLLKQPAVAPVLPGFVAMLQWIFQGREASQARWQSILNSCPPSDAQSFPKLSQQSLKRRLDPHSFVIANNPLVQMRYLFGPSVRADVLYHSLVLSRQKRRDTKIVLSTPELQRALYYDASAIYRVLESLEQAGLLKKEDDHGLEKRTNYYSISNQVKFFEIYENQSIHVHYIPWLSLLELVQCIDRLVRFIQKLTRSKLTAASPLLRNHLRDVNEYLDAFSQRASISLTADDFSRSQLHPVNIDANMQSISDHLKQILDFLEKPQKSNFSLTTGTLSRA